MITHTKPTTRRLAAVLAFAIAFATGGAWAATNVNWGGGSGGTEAAPLDVYDLSNWSGVSALSDAYNLTFDAGNVPTVLTNTAPAGTKIANNFNLNYGTWTLLGDYKFSSFDSLAQGTSPKTATIVKKGDWELTWAAYLGRAGATTILTNVSGNIVQSGAKWFQIGNGDGGLAVVENLSGDWTLSGQLALGHGEGSAGELYWRGGNLSSGSLEVDVAYGKNSTGYIEKTTGDWTIAKSIILAYNTGASATFTHDGGTMSVGENLDVSRNGSGVFNMNGGNVTVAGNIRFGTWLVNSADTVALNLNGGIMTAKGFLCHNAKKAVSAVFDGGTFRASESGSISTSDHFSEEDLVKYFNFAVGPNGGTIDTAGHDIINVVNFTRTSGSGGMRFVGGGSVVLTGTIGYTGKTSVEIGTKLEVTDASAKNTILNTCGLDIVGFAEAGDYTVFTYEGGLDASADLDNVTCSFAPDSTFDVVGNSIVCHYVPQTIEGAYWTGAANDGNLGTAGNWSGNQVPTSGNVTIALAAPATLTVGDTFRADTITIPDYSSVVTIGDGDLYLSGSLTNANKLAIASGASLNVAGDLVVTENNTAFLHGNEGTVEVGGNVRGYTREPYINVYQYENATAYTQPIRTAGIAYDCGGSGRLYMFLYSKDNSAGQWIVGRDGISFPTARNASYSRVYTQAGAPATIHSSADWTLGTKPGTGTDGEMFVQSKGTITLDTSDFDDSAVGRKITLNGRMHASGSGSAITVAGCGTVVVNTAGNLGDGEEKSNTRFDSGTTLYVTDTATLQVNAGKKILGEGTISLAAGTTLKLMSGNDRTFPTFETLALALPAEGTATLKIDGEKPLAGGDYVLFGNVPAGYKDHLTVTGTALGERTAKLKDDGENLILAVPHAGLSIIIK